MSDWQEYAEGLRKIASARESAARREDQLASERASRVSAANAAVSAVAKQRQQIEQRLTELRELTGTPGEGPRDAVDLGSVTTFDDVLRSATRLREQWLETADALEQAQRREREARHLLRDRALTAGVLVAALVIATLVASWVEGAAVLVGALVVRVVAMSWVFGVMVALLVLLVVIGGPWWLVLPAAVVLTGVVRFVRSR